MTDDLSGRARDVETLAARLRHISCWVGDECWIDSRGQRWKMSTIIDEAAATIESLASREAVLREALEPFAKLATEIERYAPSLLDSEEVGAGILRMLRFAMGDFRRARKALSVGGEVR